MTETAKMYGGSLYDLAACFIIWYIIKLVTKALRDMSVNKTGECANKMIGWNRLAVK